MDKKPSLLTLSILVSLAAIGALFFTPGVPYMSKDFDVSARVTQFTIIIYLVGYALGQLFYGPISNKYGRKPTLILGLTIAAVASLFCALSKPLEAFWLLLISRFFLALGSASGYVLTFTIIADAFSLHESKHVLPKVALGLCVFPYGGVVIGGLLVQWMDWASTFYFLTFLCIVLIYLVSRLPETGSPSKKVLISPMKIIRQYYSVLKGKRVLIFSLPISGCVATFYIFGGSAPFLAINRMGLESYQYGFFNIIITTGFASAAIFAVHIGKKLSGSNLSMTGVILSGLSILVMGILFLVGVENPWSLFLPMFFVTWGIMFIWSNCAILATKDETDKAHATGMMSFINVAVGTVALLIVSFFEITTPILLPIVFWTIVLFQFSILLYSRKRGFS